MEYTVTEAYNAETNLLRKKLIIGCLGRDIDVDIYKSLDNTFIRIHISDTNITNFETKSIKYILQHINNSHRFLCTDREEAILHLVKLNSEFNAIKNLWNVFYYDSQSLSTELQEFAHSFVSQIESNIISVPTVDKNEIESILNLDAIGLLDCTLDNSNGRVYMDTNGETHHMSYEDTVSAILEDQDNVMYHLRTKYDRINLLRIQMGYSPVKLFNHFGVLERCRLLIAMTKLCNDNNIPVRDDIANFMYKDQGFLYYTTFFESNLCDIAKNTEIENFKKYEFDNLEEALAFVIHLCVNNENYILLYGKRFTVCYNSEISYSSVHVPSHMKIYLPALFESDNSDHNAHIINNSSLSDLFKYKVVRGNICDGTHVHIDPNDGLPLPLTYHILDGFRLRCVSGLSKSFLPFNRTNLNISKVSVSFVGQYLMIDSVKLGNHKFPKEDQDIVLKYTSALWQKGYFLTTYGLMYYVENKQILPHCIACPAWFTLTKSNIKDFQRFMDFNFSEYL